MYEIVIINDLFFVCLSDFNYKKLLIGFWNMSNETIMTSYIYYNNYNPRISFICFIHNSCFF